MMQSANAPERSSRPAARVRMPGPVELFYDLGYAVTLSQMAQILADGVDALSMARFLLASLVTLQAWAYMTGYAKRFGCERWYEKVALVVHLLACVMVANTLPRGWNDTLAEFGLSMLAGLGTVAFLHVVRMGEGHRSAAMAASALKGMLPACVCYAAIPLVAMVAPHSDALGIALVAIPALVSTGGPLMAERTVSGHESSGSFAYMCRRLEQLSVLSLGLSLSVAQEALAQTEMSLTALAMFAPTTLMLGCYVVQMHDLVDHRSTRRGQLLIHAHFPLVTAVNLHAASLRLLLSKGEAAANTCVSIAVALLAFYVCLLLLSSYHRREVDLAPNTWRVLYGLVGAGAVVSLLGAGGRVAAFLAGPLVSGVGCLLALLVVRRDSRG